jgi:hypothetical protein
MKTKNHPFNVPDKFDLAITNAHLYMGQMDSPPALILKGAIVKKSLLRRSITIGDVFSEKLYTAHVMGFLIPALKELKMQEPEELIGTIQHMHKCSVSDVLYAPYNLPQWIPCP